MILGIIMTQSLYFFNNSKVTPEEVELKSPLSCISAYEEALESLLCKADYLSPVSTSFMMNDAVWGAIEGIIRDQISALKLSLEEQFDLLQDHQVLGNLFKSNLLLVSVY
jgi:hypothetical protein